MNNLRSKLAAQGKLKAIDPQSNLSQAYAQKAKNSLKAAKLLHKGELYENAISASYYAMYNITQALLMKAGILCKNHAMTITVLKTVLEQQDASEKLKNAKQERIDKQYYIQDEDSIRQDSEKLLLEAEELVIHIRTNIGRMKQAQVEKIQEQFNAFLAS